MFSFQSIYLISFRNKSILNPRLDFRMNKCSMTLMWVFFPQPVNQLRIFYFNSLSWAIWAVCACPSTLSTTLPQCIRVFHKNSLNQREKLRVPLHRRYAMVNNIAGNFEKPDNEIHMCDSRPFQKMYQKYINKKL